MDDRQPTRPDPDRASEADPERVLRDLAARLSRGRTGLISGGAIGIALGVTATAVLAAPLPFVAVGAALAVSGGCIGALLGHLIAVGRLGRVMTDVAGSDLASTRIRDAVRGRSVPLSASEARRAERLAAVAALALPPIALRPGLVTIGLTVGGLALLAVLFAVDELTSGAVVTGLTVLGNAALSGSSWLDQRRQARAAAVFRDARCEASDSTG